MSKQPISDTRPLTDQHSMGRSSWRERHQPGPGWKQNMERMKGERLAQRLGWLSMGLGILEIAAPGKVVDFLGVRKEDRLLLGLLGVREIASGIGILSQRRPIGWIWSRIGGDIMDVAVLSAAFTLPNAKRDRIVAATAMVAGVTAMDWLCVQRLSGNPSRVFEDEMIPVKKTIAVNRSAEEIYRFWRDIQNLPRFMTHVISVRVINERKSHWVVQAPGGTTIEWEAEITEDQPNELIAWRTCEGTSVSHSGSVRFMRGPGGHGTIVTVKMQYSPPGGVMGAALASLMGNEPGQQIQEDLRRLKQVMETGEVVRSEGSLVGTALSQQRPGHPPASAGTSS